MSPELGYMGGDRRRGGAVLWSPAAHAPGGGRVGVPRVRGWGRAWGVGGDCGGERAGGRVRGGGERGDPRRARERAVGAPARGLCGRRGRGSGGEALSG